MARLWVSRPAYFCLRRGPILYFCRIQNKQLWLLLVSCRLAKSAITLNWNTFLWLVSIREAHLIYWMWRKLLKLNKYILHQVPGGRYPVQKRAPWNRASISMTISYQRDVASSTAGGFTRLLFKWKGSLYKLIYRELLLFQTAYVLLSLIYRQLLTKNQRR